ncbi:FtsX-like permease family protein [Nocardioides terrae]|nr:ABC transporter permease [Nocardioides terrae]
MRSDPGLLVLTGLVVAVTVALTASVEPLGERTADRAIAATVRDAGTRSQVVATAPTGYDDPRGAQRDPLSDVKLRQDAEYAQYLLPPVLESVLRPGVATLSTPPLQLLDDGPGRYLRLVYVDTPHGPPGVTYGAGGAPKASVGRARASLTVRPGAQPWPVQVALSQAAATALGLHAGDRVPAEDEHHRRFSVHVTGVYTATDAEADAWQTSPQLLDPAVGVADGVPTASAAALVSVASLPDLRVGVPADDLSYRVIFDPEPSQLRWHDTEAVQRAIGALQSSRGTSQDAPTWDSLLVRVLDDGRAQVTAAQGQAQVLLVGLLASALLVLVLAAQLLVDRRRGSVIQARERGASLLGVGLELLVEALLVAVAGAAVGLATTWLLVGDASWAWSVPVLVVAATATPILGAVAAARATSARRVPANRSARRIAIRARRLQRLGAEVAVLGAAVLSFVALRQRGVGDLTAASAALWWAVAGTVVVVRLLPRAIRLTLRATRRSSGDVRFLVAARLAEAGARALPLLVVAVAVAQLTFGLVLAASEREGQAAGAMLAVGGDARLTAPPDPAVADTARSVAAAPGVQAAVAARVADDVPASSERSAEPVRLVVVDATAYARIVATFAPSDSTDLERLRAASREDARVPALLLGDDADLRDSLAVQWEKARIPLVVVGEAPRVDASVGPVVVVDSKAFAAAGAVADPNTVWAVGPGAAAAVKADAGPSGTVVTYTDVLQERRRAPLSSGLVRLAVASAVLLMLVALLGVSLAAATQGPARGASLGRLRSLGLAGGDLRKVLVGELLIPAVVAVLAGLALGIGAASAMFGLMSLGSITGGTGTPALVLPWSLAVVVATVLVGVLLLALVEWRRLRRQALAQLLRA